MALNGPEIIEEQGLSAAIMAWEGKELNWGRIIWNQMNIELSKKKTRNPLLLYGVVYISKFCKSDLPALPSTRVAEPARRSG